MFKIVLLLIFALINISHQSSTQGTVELNDITFDKIISKFDVALVKFDVAYPYGDKHDVFTSLAIEVKDINKLLLAEVGVKDYGEKDNEELAKKYGANKDNFPVVVLFVKDKSPVTFKPKNGFTSTELRKFIRDNSGLYVPLPGCIEKLDKLAFKFLAAEAKERKAILEEVSQLVNQYDDVHAVSAKVYKLVMERVLDKGDGFISSEYERVKKLTTNKMSEEKKTALNTKLNIIQTFMAEFKTEKDEL